MMSLLDKLKNRDPFLIDPEEEDERQKELDRLHADGTDMFDPDFAGLFFVGYGEQWLEDFEINLESMEPSEAVMRTLEYMGKSVDPEHHKALSDPLAPWYLPEEEEEDDFDW